ncbi:MULTISPECIES: hypothetical protein [Amycolatopsis]|uniref:hypothetical protein n=1 Tax=Amycolatopsis TaxID=1813 RepID=UPI0011776E64|nr:MULTISPECIES: hypothetical protein [Amycolatopsis]
MLLFRALVARDDLPQALAEHLQRLDRIALRPPGLGRDLLVVGTRDPAHRVECRPGQGTQARQVVPVELGELLQPRDQLPREADRRFDDLADPRFERAGIYLVSTHFTLPQ